MAVGAPAATSILSASMESNSLWLPLIQIQIQKNASSFMISYNPHTDKTTHNTETQTQKNKYTKPNNIYR